LVKIISRLTIKELAVLANVSPATVSRVINKSGYVSKEVAGRVEKVIAESDFRPDSRARALRGMQSKIVALLIPDILNVYYTALAKNIEKCLREKGYIMVLGITNDVSETYIHHLNQFWDMQVDGIIHVPPPKSEAPSIARSLFNRGMPMVELNRRREEDIFDAVLADNFGGIKQGMQYLLGIGHRKIALISGPVNTTTGKLRLEGYQFSLVNAGIPVDESYIKIGQFNKEYGLQAAKELLESENRPTAIFSGNNRILMGVMTYLLQKGIQVPHEISILAFDDSEWCEFSQPPITAIDIAVDNMASLAVDLIIKRVQNGTEAGSPMTYTLSTNFMERQSCKKIN
jgi:LacI family transcriptional regulator